MNIANLTVGYAYKNWKELCATLSVEPKPSGKARKPQEKEFKRYFNWEKQGQKITITEIYDEPKEKEDGRRKSTKNISLINNIYNWGNINCTFSEDTEYLRKRLKEEMEMNLEESSLSVYNAIISQIEGKTLKQLIAKSIINQLFLQLSRVGQVGFTEAWWLTDAELYQATGMVSGSYYYATRNPERFCEKVKDLQSDDLQVVLDHMGVNKEWLKSQRASVLKYLTNDLHLISHTDKAYFFVMRTTRIRGGVALTNEEFYYPTLDELEWINVSAIPNTMAEHNDKNGKPYTSLNKIKTEGKIKEFYQEWLPEYINRNLPTGWGHVTNIYKCHRIGFAPDVIEYAVKNQMRLLVQEKQILNDIANSVNVEVKGQVTTNRNEQSEKRHHQAVDGKGRAKEEVRELRCRDSYIGVGYAVNRELHSKDATYHDFTRRKGGRGSGNIVSKVQEQ